jgi:DNA repair exonuclease SbcCD ATPase subunit
VEARDRDAVSGAKTGSSRTLYVVIARPQESIDDRLDRQRDVLERLTADLADRLELPGPGSPRGGPSAVAEAETRHAAYAAVHESAEAHVTLLGRLVDEDRREGSLGKSLRAALAGIADRLGKLLREEKDALGAAREGSGHGGTIVASVAKLDAHRERHVAELEKDVLQLDSLIGRQRLEDLAAVGRELTDAHRRLQDLLARYASTKDEALRRQLEREVRDLRTRIADLAQKIANLKTRNEVPDEWRNLPDTKNLADQAKRLDDLLAHFPYLGPPNPS